MSDTGAGIPEEKQDLLFKEFARLEPTETAGVGLGLAISRSIAHALGGEITHLPGSVPIHPFSRPPDDCAAGDYGSHVSHHPASILPRGHLRTRPFSTLACEWSWESCFYGISCDLESGARNMIGPGFHVGKFLQRFDGVIVKSGSKESAGPACRVQGISRRDLTVTAVQSDEEER